jgi:hypothetical protein
LRLGVLVKAEGKSMYSCRKNFYPLIFPALAAILCFNMAACVTNTIADTLIYPSESYYSYLSDDEKGLAMCMALEAQGYQFDEFLVSEIGLEIAYPDGHQQLYPQSYSVHPVVLTDIERDYNNPDIFSENEYLRVEEEAKTFCRDYQQVASDIDINLPLEGILYWDYIDGVRGGFWFTESCNISGSYGWGTGSYASDYEPNPALICPSGHVVH